MWATGINPALLDEHNIGRIKIADADFNEKPLSKPAAIMTH